MTTRYASHINRRETPQSEQVPGTVKNNAGGYVYEVDKWQRLERFLILGSDGGTYYVKERELTRDNAAVVEACVAEDANRTIETICEVSDSGRAPKNDPAILALAICAASSDPAARKLAYAALPRVCRIPTHLFHFLEYCKALRGWSSGLRNAVSKWYARWTPEKLAHELVKYQSRDRWSNRDAFRLSHPKLGDAYQGIVRWAAGLPFEGREVKRKKAGRVDSYPAVAHPGGVVAAFEEAKTADTTRLITLIREHGLTREMIPTEMLKSRYVWQALLEKMPLTAMIRNLGKMTSIELLQPLSDEARFVASMITDQDKLRKARVHPLAILNAMRVYASGHGDKGSLSWSPVREVLDALDAAFYLSFGNVEPTNKRLMLALDVSGSMSASIAGTSLSCREAAAAMALVTANVEKTYMVVGFTNTGTRSSQWAGYRAGLTELAISPRQRLDDVVHYLSGLPFGGTDCSLPMLHASEKNIDIDAFCVYTDSETWAGNIHPQQALRKYRGERVADAKEVVVGMTATEFTIADPADPLTLDVVGFDLATPQAISAFVSA